MAAQECYWFNSCLCIFHRGYSLICALNLTQQVVRSRTPEVVALKRVTAHGGQQAVLRSVFHSLGDDFHLQAVPQRQALEIGQLLDWRHGVILVNG